MTIKTIRELWPERVRHPQNSLAWWNNHSKMYTDRELPNATNNIAMRIIEKENINLQGTKSLDVGCGIGRLSLALAKKGSFVTGIDFSDQMLIKANDLNVFYDTDVLFLQENWETLDLQEKGWSNAYDLVLAHMTPAVNSVDTLIKLSSASRGWVIIVKPTRRTSNLLDPLRSKLNRPSENDPHIDTWPLLIATIWAMGYCPKLDYETSVWESHQTLEEAIESYTLRLNMESPLNDQEKHMISDYLREISKNGHVYERTDVTLSALYWLQR